MKIIAAAVVSTIVLCASMSDARAIGLLETSATNAAGNCQAALPAFEGLIRKRPLAVVNEGTSNAFITCSLTTPQLSLGIQGYSARMSNASGSTQQVACTAVTGEEGSAKYFTKTVTLQAGESKSLDYSYLLDNLGVLFSKRLSFSCSLPPGVGLNNNSVTSVLSLL